MTWHLLQVSDTLDMELGSALAESVPLLAWEPVMSSAGSYFGTVSKKVRYVSDPPLNLSAFPLMRGYARFPLSLIANTGPSVLSCLLEKTEEPSRSPLICTTPYLVSVATRWPGPVVYWLSDRMECYEGANPYLVRKLDRVMCNVATVVCPNSARLAEYLIKDCGCRAQKVHILPNATRKSNLFPTLPDGPTEVPIALRGLKRPIAGVIGNLAGNMDWLFLEDSIQRSPNLSWAFVGPTSMPIRDEHQSAARARVMIKPGTRFVGKQPYGDLAAYARCFDVAVLPYLRCEPTYSGSSTRFYEHLAACRPMIATRGFEELTRKEPLLWLVDHSEEAAEALSDLESSDFADGFANLRWSESQNATWQNRAEELKRELAVRLT